MLLSNMALKCARTASCVAKSRPPEGTGGGEGGKGGDSRELLGLGVLLEVKEGHMNSIAISFDREVYAPIKKSSLELIRERNAETYLFSENLCATACIWEAIFSIFSRFLSSLSSLAHQPVLFSSKEATSILWSS